MNKLVRARLPQRRKIALRKILENWGELRIRQGVNNHEYVIRAETPTDELSQLAIKGLSGYFRTHPLPSERLVQAQRIIAQDHLPVDKALKPFRVEYEITADDP